MPFTKVKNSWSKQTSGRFAGRECKANQTYTACGSQCPRTCGVPLTNYMSEECNKCVPGCQCKQGLMAYNNTCVPPSECPCTYKSNVYSTGEITETVDHRQIW